MAKKTTEIVAVEPVSYDKLKADLLTRFGLPFAQEVYRHRVEAARINAERSLTPWVLPECEIAEEATSLTEHLYTYLTSQGQ
jgi:hypothetical protein